MAGRLRVSGSLAAIADLCDPDAMELDVPTPLLEDLHALAAISGSIHGDICWVHDPENPDGCTCGAPKVLRQLAELLPLPVGAVQPYRPSWSPSRAA
jgi:hypothetical protein